MNFSRLALFNIIWLLCAIHHGDSTHINSTTGMHVNTDLAAVMMKVPNVWTPTYYWNHIIEVRLQDPEKIMSQQMVMSLNMSLHDMERVIANIKRHIDKEPINGTMPDYYQLLITESFNMHKRIKSRLFKINSTLKAAKINYRTLTTLLDHKTPTPKLVRPVRAVLGSPELPVLKYNPDAETIHSNPTSTTTSRPTLETTTIISGATTQSQKNHSKNSRPQYNQVDQFPKLNKGVEDSVTFQGTGLVHVSRGGVVHQHFSTPSMVSSMYQYPMYARGEYVTQPQYRQQPDGGLRGLLWPDINPDCHSISGLPWINNTEVNVDDKPIIKDFVMNVVKVYPITEALLLNNTATVMLVDLYNTFRRLPIVDRNYICNNLLDLKVCQDPTMVIRDPNIRRNRRVRRDDGSACDVNFEDGWLSYDFSFAKLMWGGADNKDLNLLVDHICKNQRAIIAVGTQLQKQIEDGLAVTSSIIDSVSKETMKLRGEVVTLTEQIGNWSAQVEKDLEDNVRLINYMELHLSALQAMVDMHEYSSIISDLSIDLETNTRIMQGLLASLSQEKAPAEFLDENSLAYLTTYVSKNVGSEYQFIPDYPLSTLILNSKTYMYRIGSTLIYSIYIPMTRKDSTWSYWELKKIPVPVNQIWVQLALDYYAIGHEEETGTISLFRDDEWSSCISSPIRLCPKLPLLSRPMDRNCIIGLMNNNAELMDSCQLKGVPTSYAARTYALLISDDSWLVTTSHTNQEAISQCSDKKGLVVTRREAVVSTQIVKIPLNCIWTLDNITLYPMVPPDYHQRQSYYARETFIDTDSGEVKLSKPMTPTWVTRLNLATTKLNITVRREVDSDIPTGVIALKNITDYVRRNNVAQVFQEIYAANGSSQPHGISSSKNQPTLRKSYWSISPDWSPVEHLELWALSILNIVLTGFIITRCILSRRRSTTANIVAGAAGVRLLPDMMKLQSMASPLKPLGINLKEVISSTTLSPAATTKPTIIRNITGNSVHTSSNVSSEQFLIEMNQTLSYLTDLTIYSKNSIIDAIRAVLMLHNPLHLFPWIVPLITMLVMMIYVACCHCLLLRVINSRIAQSEVRLGKIPLNKRIAHHVAETRVVMVCLLRLSNQLPGYLQLRPAWNFPDKLVQCAFQLCTIPGSATDWVVTRQPDASGFISGKPCAWRDTSLRARLKWGPFCLRQTQELRVSACESLPTLVNVNASEIREQIREVMPHRFVSMTVVGVLAIQLIDQGSSITAYIAGQTPKGNRIAEDQKIPLATLA